MKPGPRRLINPSELAFDIDGVVADTMDVFVQLARDRYGFRNLSKEDLTSYDLHRCLDFGKEILDDLICLTLSDEHTRKIPPVPGAPEFLSELARHTPLRFITARIWPESITEWLYSILPDVNRTNIHVIASGAPEAKLAILEQLGIRYFVEDRIETCRQLKNAGIQPFLFDQPWNRNETADGFVRIGNWVQLKEWVLLPGTNLR